MGNWLGIESRTSCLVRLIPTTTLLRMTIYVPSKVFNLIPFSWNFCLQTPFKAVWAVLNMNLFKDILRENKALTGKILVFWTGSCLIAGGYLSEVVAHGSLTVLCRLRMFPAKGQCPLRHYQNNHYFLDITSPVSSQHMFLLIPQWTFSFLLFQDPEKGDRTGMTFK